MNFLDMYNSTLSVLRLFVVRWCLSQITATHQLESSLTTLALAARALLLASAKESSSEVVSAEIDTAVDKVVSGLDVSLSECRSTLAVAMFSTLLGLDANDPPKTLATLQLYCSVISSVSAEAGKSLLLIIISRQE